MRFSVGPSVHQALESAANEDTTRKKVILVRDEQMQIHLQDRLRSNSLVFTILESKGMEYDEVILYEFFSTCPCPNSLRSFASSQHDGKVVVCGDEHPVSCTEIESATHHY